LLCVLLIIFSLRGLTRREILEQQCGNAQIIAAALAARSEVVKSKTFALLLSDALWPIRD